VPEISQSEADYLDFISVSEKLCEEAIREEIERKHSALRSNHVGIDKVLHDTQIQKESTEIIARIRQECEVRHKALVRWLSTKQHTASSAPSASDQGLQKYLKDRKPKGH